MLCDKCKREYADDLGQCPYCNEQEEAVEVTVLQPGERDNFEGITISGGEEEPKENNKKNYQEHNYGTTHIYHTSFNSGGYGLLWQILFLIIIAGVIFILLPAFLLLFLGLAVVYYVIRLFR